MKKSSFIFSLFYLSVACIAQVPQVVTFRHELRWADETKFPNYFMLPEVRDSVFNSTKLELMNYLQASDIKFPGDVLYKIIPGFGKQKTEMPASVAGNDPAIGIFSFITRANTGYAMFWKLKIIIKQNNTVILDKEVSHELEYFNASGYVESKRFITAEEFQDIFHRLVKETLGYAPATDEKIVVGSLDPIEEKIRSIRPPLKRTLLKMAGGWKSGGNFSGLVEAEKDTLLKFYFKAKTIEEVKPSLTPFLATLFTETTGIDFQYDRDIKRELNGTVTFTDNQNFVIKLKWIGTITRSVMDGDVAANISNPVSAELYEQKVQTGYFLYVSMEKVNSTAKTTEKFNAFSGYQKENTLGTERYDRIKGSLSGKPIFGEFNENQGIIMINTGDTLLGVMAVENCNPESRTVSGSKVSKNKVFIVPSGNNKRTQSLEDNEKVEWYPLYLPENSSDESRKLCVKTLICLFFGISNMPSGTSSPDDTTK